MSAVLFGSISTIADTSELQREAFNQAFEAHGLDWHWSREDYLDLLRESGGAQRIAAYASSLGQDVDAKQVHRTKSELFQKRLAEAGIAPRSGVVETVRDARQQGFKVALVTTTATENVAALIEALGPEVQRSDFDLVVDASDVERPKPDDAAYRFALASLDEQPVDCIAIEDNLGGVQAAVGAGLRCVAFPNQNTAGHAFDQADQVVDRLRFSDLQTFIPGA